MKKLIGMCVVVVLLLVCSVPFPKKIEGTFPTIDQDGNDIVVTVKGTYYDYLIRKDQFEGVLIDEAGIEYPAIEKQKIVPDTVDDNTVLGISFAYLDYLEYLDGDPMNTIFATAYFEEDLAGILYCIFID